MARLPKTVMNMAPVINEYMATRTPRDLSLSAHDPFPYSEQSRAFYIKEGAHGILSETKTSTLFLGLLSQTNSRKKYSRLKEDNYTEI